MPGPDFTDPADLVRLIREILFRVGQLEKRLPPKLPSTPAATGGCECWIGKYHDDIDVDDATPVSGSVAYTAFTTICGTEPTGRNVTVNGQAAFALTGAGNREFQLNDGAAPSRVIAVPGVSTSTLSAQCLPVSIITSTGPAVGWALWQDSGGSMSVSLSLVAHALCCECTFPGGG